MTFALRGAGAMTYAAPDVTSRTEDRTEVDNYPYSYTLHIVTFVVCKVYTSRLLSLLSVCVGMQELESCSRALVTRPRPIKERASMAADPVVGLLRPDVFPGVAPLRPP